MEQEFEIQGNTLIKYHGTDPDVIIPDGIERIGDYAFCDKGKYISPYRFIKSVWIPDGMTSIGHSAFRNCCNLQQVHLPDSLIRMESYAFRNTLIEELVLPDNLHYINDDALEIYVLKKIFCLGVAFTPCRKVYPLAHFMKSLRTDKVPAMKMLLDSGQEQAVIQSYETFISHKNIDRLIRLAIDKKAYQLQILLMDYKEQHHLYQDIADKLKL